MKARLLYVEDDDALAFVTKDNLEQQGYEIIHCADGQEALSSISTDNYDLCLLDVMLPGIDGFALAEQIRSRNKEVPILFLTAKSLKEDKLQGLRLGADDYITKPFSIEELVLKIEVFLRRTRKAPALWPCKLGRYDFNHPNLTLEIDGQVKNLTQREADLLKVFCENPNQVIKRSDILENLWGENDYFMGRSLDVFISRLRKYLSEDDALDLENIPRVGFRMNVRTQPA